MKVVLFCGGLGTRIREYSENIPKPMVPVGHQPILWHVMQYYSQYGHKDFVLCLGYKANIIKEFFLNYQPQTYMDCVVSGRLEGRAARQARRGLARHADRHRASGATSASGCWAVRDHVEERGDVPRQLQRRPDRRRLSTTWSRRSRRAASSPASWPCGPPLTYHLADIAEDGSVRGVPLVRPIRTSGSTAATSSCARRSSTTCARARSWCSSRSSA